MKLKGEQHASCHTTLAPLISHFIYVIGKALNSRI